ncbi:MAG: translocation/assembly module TamB domain-containing protein, partial [Bacteriovorax sp.]|nr:translocation/assembly module TamB domain-containing protein [Bacteriovorax sp.]
NFSDARKMYNLVFKNIKLPVVPEFNFSTVYRVRGGYSVESLKIDGKILGTDLKVFNEEADRLSLDFSLQNNLLTFKDIKIYKSRGEINAGVTINLANNYTELDGSMQGLRLSDFNFYQKLKMEYDGDLVVDFDGNGTKENFSSRFKTKVNNPFIANIPASPSSAIIYLNADDVVVNANLLSGKIKLDSLINFKSRQVSVKSSVDTTDMREMLGIFAGHNMSEKNISGKIKAQLNSQFNMDTLVVSKFFLNFSQFNLKKGDVNLNVDPKHEIVAIDNGVVKNWDLRFTDNEDFFISKAKNLPSGAIVFDQNFSIKASLLEFATSSVDRAVGVMKGASQFIIDKKVTVTKFELKGIKNSLKIKNLPGAITDLEYGIIKKGDVFEISRFTGNYGEGEFKASGTFIFDDLYPQVNIDYRIDRSTISLFKRSSLLASSSGTITGTDLPYKLNGKVTLLYGEFLDDPSDFTKENKVNLDVFKKYLPQKSAAEKKGYINLNVSFDTVNPILLKNNLAEVYAKGSGQLTGDILDPEINARVEVIPTVSKFKFKGHDFLLNQGYVEIRDHGKSRVSDLKFIGLTKINDYDVKLDISGSIEKSNINLSSEPPLAQEDLVSLLTLGVTSDMSKNLEASDRKSVTTVGIGTLLVDQLKINEDLNSTLGLNLSVLPEFKEDETSLVSGKSAINEGATSKLKTGTKIKLHKQVSKLIDVSVSSTVGGSIEQTQEMNVNFNINKNFSIEGVYEVKPAEDENTNTPNSVGADLKYRRSF